MDLERELRLAMAEHLDGAKAPEELATAVSRRHHRRVVRIRTTVAVVAAGAAVAVAAPTYHAVKATPAGGERRLPTHRPAGPSPERARPPAAGVTPAAPSPTGPAGVPAPAATGGPQGGHQPKPSGRPELSSPSSWVTYLPPGLKPAGPCLPGGTAGRPSTTCRWSHGTDWFTVDVVRAPSLTRPEELGVASALARHTTVHGHQALSVRSPDGGGRTVWIERPGVGVVVVVSRALNDRLPRIAGGVRLGS
ncbi:hypothetical protein ACRYCC_07065 [Actinomadura scrupuli]|uniref:hypothetical protein n=1 Tax=Actinomadura scrupuli TaxID=559629 RepID=UPI003D9533AC